MSETADIFEYGKNLKTRKILKVRKGKCDICGQTYLKLLLNEDLKSSR